MVDQEIRVLGDENIIANPKNSQKQYPLTFKAVSNVIVYGRKKADLNFTVPIPEGVNFNFNLDRTSIIFADNFNLEEYSYIMVKNPFEEIQDFFYVSSLEELDPTGKEFNEFNDEVVKWLRRLVNIISSRCMIFETTLFKDLNNFPNIKSGQTFIRTDDGWTGITIRDINSELDLIFNKYVEEINKKIQEHQTQMNELLEQWKQDIQKYAENVKQYEIVRIVTQTGHGFVFEPVMYSISQRKFVKAVFPHGADGVAVRVDDNNFRLVWAGRVEIPSTAKDTQQRDFVLGEYYFLGEGSNGGIQREKPDTYYQHLFQVMYSDELQQNIADVLLSVPINQKGKRWDVGEAKTTVNDIEELKMSDFPVGKVVEVLGYYKAGDGADHKRIIKAEDDGSGVQLSNNLWACIVHNGEVNVSWFGAKGDGVVDDSDIINKAIFYAEQNNCIINITKNLLIKKTFTLNNITLNGNNNEIVCDFDVNSSIAIINNVVLKNVILKSTKRILNIVNVEGNNNIISNIKIFNTEKASFVPEPPNYIKYNQGCIYINGTNNTVENNEFYNNEGAGIYIRGTYINIKNNYIHDNVSGIILDNNCENCSVIENKIINNNAVKTEGADGILSKCKTILIQGNIIKGSGEHGAYIQGYNSTCIGNIVENSEHCGIKYSGVKKGIILSNTVNDNMAKLGYNEAQIYLQWSCNDIVVNSNINNSNVNNCFFIRSVEKLNSELRNIKVVNNIGLGTMVINGTEHLDVINNSCDEILFGSYSTVNIPKFCKIKGNNVNQLNMLELHSSEISDNDCENLNLKFDATKENIIINNNISNQTSQINTRTFIEFSSNNLTTKMDTALFVATEKKDNIVIKNNIFNLSKINRGLYEPIVSYVSGDNWNINKNRIFGSEEVFCNYGNNHIITENFVNGNKSLGYFGCSNSIVTHNQAIVNFRSGVSGNIDTENINANNLNIAKLNTPYHTEKMKQEGVYNDFITYMDEKTSYDKQQRKLEQDRQLAYEEALKENPKLTYEEFMSLQPMTLNLVEEPQPSDALKKFMEKYL